MDPVEELLAALLPPRPKRRKPRRPRYPRGLEKRYESALRAINREFVKIARKEMRRVLATARDEPRRDAVVDFLVLIEALGNIIRQNPTVVAAMARVLDRFVPELVRVNTAENERVLGLSLADQTPAVAAFTRVWRRNNIELVQSIGERLHDDLSRVVQEAAASGMRVETLARRIEERFVVSESRARLIARDQINKGNADLTKARHREVGVERYRWSTSRDERVRKSHRQLNGKEFSYANPPLVDGRRLSPGEDYQCRCVAIPIFDD